MRLMLCFDTRKMTKPLRKLVKNFACISAWRLRRKLRNTEHRNVNLTECYHGFTLFWCASCSHYSGSTRSLYVKKKTL